jgi:signal transduction histidine kinase
MSAPHVANAPSTEARLRELLAATASLISEVSLDGVLRRVVRVAAEVIGARYAAIGVLGPDGTTLEHFMTHGMDAEAEQSVGSPPRGRGILGLVTRQARPIRLRDLTEHPEFHGFPPHHPPMQSFLGVPILGSHGTVGSLYLTGKIGGEVFTEEDEDIATLLATKIAVAAENARRHEESARLLKEVQQLHRARERFFAMVNHELRNAIAAVHGWSEMLVRKRDPAKVPRAALEVLESAKYAVALINDLLDLSRLDENRLQPVIRAVDAISIASRAVSLVTPAAERKQVTIQLNADTGLPTCETDANRVEQILVNLLGNAITYAPERTVVQVSVTAKDRRVLYTVEDTGPGVRADDVERIFDVYVTKVGEESRGLGLGLPLSRRLARLLGGELHAIAVPGGGGHFVLEVPATRR